MTTQLDSQRRELIQANQQLDERRRFTETVLAGVSAGVIGLDREGRIILPNRRPRICSASTIRTSLIGRSWSRWCPSWASCWAPTGAVRPSWSRRSSQLRRAATAADPAGPRRRRARRRADRGFVVTFDDITELLSAQRQAAWAEVARRIAHEVKNPLTPIRLSAERLRRKYLQADHRAIPRRSRCVPPRSSARSTLSAA